VGTICHDTPYLSTSQPHWISLPPVVSYSQYSSTSSCASQLTTNEIAELKLVLRAAVQRHERLPVEIERDRSSRYL
jgi:hypothetical protein